MGNIEAIMERHPRVLIIEDDPCYCRLLERYVERCGGYFRRAADGKAGLEKAMAGQFDMAFVDIQLPKMDGFMVAMLLREYGFPTPLVAMTSLQFEGMKPKAITMGFNEFLIKPISENMVAKLLRRYAGCDTETGSFISEQSAESGYAQGQKRAENITQDRQQQTHRCQVRMIDACDDRTGSRASDTGLTGCCG